MVGLEPECTSISDNSHDVVNQIRGEDIKPSGPPHCGFRRLWRFLIQSFEINPYHTHGSFGRCRRPRLGTPTQSLGSNLQAHRTDTLHKLQKSDLEHVVSRALRSHQAARPRCASVPLCMRRACHGSAFSHTRRSIHQRRLLVWRSFDQRCIWRGRPSIVAAVAVGTPGDQAFRTLMQPHSLLLVVKASKFLTTAWPVNSRAEVPLN